VAVPFDRVTLARLHSGANPGWPDWANFRLLGAGWPGEFVKKSPKTWPNQFFVKINP
jgi:hypothetical protein